MAGNDVVNTLTIKTVSDGAPQATKDLQDLASAMGGVSVASDNTSKSTLSAAAALNKLQNQLDPGYRSLTQLNSAQATLGRSFDQGLVTIDRYNQLMGLASQRFDDAGKKASPLAVALTGVKTQMVALSAGLGPVGTALAAFGPVGLAVGAAFGALGAAFEVLKDQANDAGQWATTLQQASNIIGLNTTQIQGLNEAAASVGVTASDNIAAFEKFSVALGQLKDGSGTLYTELLKVNPQLVNQLSVTKDSATAWNLLAQAYSSANAQQQALITRAAFGRGGAAEGQVLSATANAGGVNNLAAANEDAISQDQIKKWADLTTQINSATEAAQHNFQSIFTTDILNSEKAFADNLLNVSRYAKDFSLSDDLKYYLSKLGSGALAIAGTLPVVGPVIQGAQALGSALTTPGAVPAPASPGQSLVTGIAGLKQSGYNPDQSDFIAASLGVQSAQASAAVSFLGSAATATDKYNASVAKLNLEVANNSQLTGLQGRALASLNLDRLTSLQTTYNSALGELATTQDLVNAKDLAFQKAQQQNSSLTNDQKAAVLNLVAANDEWSRVSAQSQIGVFDLSAAQKALNDQLQAAIDKKLLDPTNLQQMAAAQQNYANKLQATADAAKVAGSAFPQLAQLAVDAGNVNKQFDTFATTSLNDFSDALVNIGSGAQTTGQAFSNFGLQVVQALEKMIIQMTIIKPLAASLGLGGTGTGLLSFLGLGNSSAGSGAAASTISVGSQSFPSFGLPSAKGNVFSNDNLVKFANGGAFTNSIVTSPTFFRFANGAALGQMGEAGPEAIVPLKRGSDGSLGVAGGGGNTIVNVNVDNSSGSDVSVGQQKNSSGGVDLNVMVRKAVDKNISQGYHDKSMKARFGSTAVGQKR